MGVGWISSHPRVQTSYPCVQSFCWDVRTAASNASLNQGRVAVYRVDPGRPFSVHFSSVAVRHLVVETDAAPM